MASLRLLLVRKDGKPGEVYYGSMYANEGDDIAEQWKRRDTTGTYVLVGHETEAEFNAARARRPELVGFAINEWRYRELYPGVWPPVPLGATSPRPVSAAPATPGPRKPPPVLPPEVHHTATFDAEAAMAAVRALSKGT